MIKTCTLFTKTAAILVLLLVAGCLNSYDQYTYGPRLAAMDANVGNGESGSVTVVATILGIRKGDGRDRVIDVGFWLENHTGNDVRLAVSEARLLSADLGLFRLAATVPAAVPAVSPGVDEKITLSFAFPAGRKMNEVDLSGLSLTWAIRSDIHLIRRTMSFVRVSRQPPRTDDPYFYRPWRSSVSVGVGHTW